MFFNFIVLFFIILKNKIDIMIVLIDTDELLHVGIHVNANSCNEMESSNFINIT